MAIEIVPNRIRPDLLHLERLLVRRAKSAGQQAERVNVPHFACATAEISVDVRSLTDLTLAEAEKGPVWYWKSSGSLFIGYGVAAQLEVQGEHRFTKMRDRFVHDTSRIVAAKSDLVRFFFGFSFSPRPLQAPWSHWPNGILTLPKFLFAVNANGTTTVTVAVEVGDTQHVPEATREVVQELESLFVKGVPLRSSRRNESSFTSGGSSEGTLLSTHPDVFHQMVAMTAADIQAGKYEKAVMARQDVLEAVDLTAVPPALEWLREAYPDNTSFALRYGEECFLGASPERLASVQSGTVSVDCLAGTTQRGNTPEEDVALGQALTMSEKNLHEHRVVVRAIKKLLGTCTTQIRLEIDQQLLRLPNVQHLYSRVSGQLCPNTSLLDLAGLLHPTPAIAGHPTVEATRAISLREPFERGWYAGGVGVMDRSGDGEIAVTLRSALATMDGAFLFAGAGIMGDSSPESEWMETELKLRPMRKALALESDGGGLD